MENQKKKRNSSNSLNKKVTFNSTKSNIKILKVTDLYKDIYSTQTGKTLSVLKSNKNHILFGLYYFTFCKIPYIFA